MTETRREFTKKLAWIAPAIMTLPVTPSMCRAGSDVPEELPTQDHNESWWLEHTGFPSYQAWLDGHWFVNQP